MYRYAVPVVVLFALFVTACAAEPPTPDISATVAAMVQDLPTRTPAPTYTPVPLQPTYTPAPSATPYPTLVALPTYTPLPTLQPLPTYTPLPTLQPLPTYTPLPTLQPLPTYTPLPALQPLPTYTPLPALQPLPTYTPLPTLQPLPTYTPLPTPTATPVPTVTPVPTRRPTLTATPTATPDDWSGTGAWYRDRELEEGVTAFVKAQGLDQDVRFATLDATPTALFNAISLTVGCIGGTKVAYFAPYTFSVPVEIDIYAIGIWDDSTGSWKEGELHYYSDPVLTDDGSAIYVVNQVQVSQIFSIIQNAVQLQNSHQVLNAGMYDEDDGGISLWGEFNPTGLDDAVAYLPCF